MSTEETRAYNREWMANKRARLAAKAAQVVVQAAHPGEIGRGRPKPGETRLCYCGCGAVVGSIEYTRHYNSRYEKRRLFRKASNQMRGI